jgi:hypothetical protein
MTIDRIWVKCIERQSADCNGRKRYWQYFSDAKKETKGGSRSIEMINKKDVQLLVDCCFDYRGEVVVERRRV